MNYFILAIIALAGVGLGMYMARKNANGVITNNPEPLNCTPDEPLDCVMDKQSEKKVENKQKILEFMQAHTQIQNNDVEKLVGVSNATAERYLDELEKEGKLTQHGVIGPNVFYSVK